MITKYNPPILPGSGKMLDAACLVDDDGGPFTFRRVTYQLDKDRLILEYDRNASSSPDRSMDDFRVGSSFSIECIRDQDSNLTGKAFSGAKGLIGKVWLSKKKEAESQLPVRQGYVGKWKGEAKLVDGKKSQLVISLQNGSVTNSNPSNYEFDFTPGKICTVNWNDTPIIVDYVFINYLDRRVECVASDTKGQMVWLLVFNFHSERKVLNFLFDRKDTIKGYIVSSIKGPVANFELTSV